MAQGLTPTSSHELRELNLARTILILSVVLIHSSPIARIQPQHVGQVGEDIVNILLMGICGPCVPLFFAISGLLFFRSIRPWSWRGWKFKLERRVGSMLVPYILWNIIASLVFMLKVRYMGADDFGVFADGDLHLPRYLAGFWDLHEGLPYDFALWFLRNLMIFCILAPVVYLIAARTSVFFVAAALYLCFVQNTNYGFEYFVAGAWLGMHPEWYDRLTGRKVAFGALAVWIVLAFFIGLNIIPESYYGLVVTVRNVSALMALPGLCRLASYDKTPVRLKKLQPAAFFIYAIHSMLCTAASKACLSLTGDSTAGIVAALFLTFAILVAVSYLAYRVCSVCCPRLGMVLSGGRS